LSCLKALCAAAFALCLPWASAHAHEGADKAPPEIGSFIQESGYTEVDPDSLMTEQYYSVERFPSMAGQASVRWPDADLDAMTRAVLILESQEADLSRVRYRLAYSMYAAPDMPDEQQALVEVTRYNLGPALRDDLAQYVATEHLAPAQEFGVGPHVSCRFVMAPVMGMSAAVNWASRKEVPDHDARRADCLGESCLSLADPSGPLVPASAWRTLGPSQLQAPGYRGHSASGVAKPARAVEELWAAIASDGMDPLPYHEEQPHFTVVMSFDVVGQDSAAQGLVRQALVMDDSISEIWTQRLEYADANPDFSELVVPRNHP